MPKTTTSIKVYCRECKAKNGVAPLEVAITLNGVRKFFTTNLKCDVKQYKTKPPKYIVQYVDSLKLNLSQTIADMAMQGIPLTCERLKTAVQKGGLESYTIADLFNDYFQILKKKVKNKQIKETVAKRYYFLRTLLEKHIDFGREATDITPNVIENFFLDIKPKYEESTLAAMITRFKTVIKYGIDNGHLRINPFVNIKVSKHPKDITFLTKEELKRIYELDIPNQSLSDVRDFFIFQASTGLSYTDAANISAEDIRIDKDGTHSIIKNRQKTGVQYATIVLPMGVEVLKKHNYRLRVISNQKLNTYLKVIQKLAGIQTNMTTHLARRTFACLLLNSEKKIRVEVVSKALGHSSIKQTLSAYAKVFDSQAIEELKVAAF